MSSGSEIQESNFCFILSSLLESGYLAMGQNMHLCNNFLCDLSLFNSILSGIGWINKLHDRNEFAFLKNGSYGISETVSDHSNCC